MRSARRVRWLALTALLPFITPSCSSPDTDCTCLAENDTEQRTLACGESACVSGTRLSCTKSAEIVRGSACMAPPAPPADSPDEPSRDGGAEPDRSCDDLFTFCATSCAADSSAAADCQATASSGDAPACSAWPLTHGALCSP